MGLRMKNFKIMEKSLKNLIFKGGSQKTNMQGELPKKDVGLGKKEGGGGVGVDTSMLIMYDLIRPLFLILVYGFNFQQGKSL